MKKVLVYILVILFILPTMSIAKQGAQHPSVRKEGVYKTKSSKKVKKQKVAKRKRVRLAHHINKPEEGDILKIEAMVKDINEQ